MVVYLKRVIKCTTENPAHTAICMLSVFKSSTESLTADNHCTDIFDLCAWQHEHCLKKVIQFISILKETWDKNNESTEPFQEQRFIIFHISNVSASATPILISASTFILLGIKLLISGFVIKDVWLTVCLKSCFDILLSSCINLMMGAKGIKSEELHLIWSLNTPLQFYVWFNSYK